MPSSTSMRSMIEVSHALRAGVAPYCRRWRINAPNLATAFSVTSALAFTLPRARLSASRERPRSALSVAILSFSRSWNSAVEIWT